MLLKIPKVNSKPESCMLCVARVKTRQVGQICSKSHHQGHLEQCLGGARCTYTAYIWGSKDVSASARAYADFSVHKIKCKGRKASDQKKSMTWRRDQREGTEDMRKPRNSSKLNSDILVLALTVEGCPLLDS